MNNWKCHVRRRVDDNLAPVRQGSGEVVTVGEGGNEIFQNDANYQF
jgi:hypothetical protein